MKLLVNEVIKKRFTNDEIHKSNFGGIKNSF